MCGTPAICKPRVETSKRAETCRATARCKILRGTAVERHHDYAAQRAAPERRHPLAAIFSPEHEALAFGDASALNSRAKRRAKAAISR